MSGVSLPSANSPSARLGLIGNPESRRIFEFQDAVQELGWPRPPCLSYEEILRSPQSLESFDADVLRIDSPGRNETVARLLIALGGGPADAPMEFGEIGYLKEFHRGFCAILDQIEEHGVPCLNPPEDIRIMFDKWACHCRFVENGIARPPSELAPANFDELLSKMRQRSNGQIFLKPLHGSSGSGVCALRWISHRQQMICPLHIASREGRPILVNDRRVRSFTTLEDIKLILNLLLPHGMIMEQWIPKISLPGGAMDLRVLVIAGEARHWVLRQGQSPVTNLHLGNRRGDITQLIERVTPRRFNEALQLAENAAECFPDCLYAGVDVLLDARGRPFIGEINAFGDLLPRLIHRADSTYTAIARAFLAQCSFV
jgi:glutathione synthase/RimK-type ligase-like ATP-grasp enzyme